MPDIVILGGPNGAGKTTTSGKALPNLKIETFVNADEIARGLSPFEPEAAALASGRLMLDQIRELISKRQSFAFETTLAGRNYAAWLRRCKEDGWHITLLYVWLSSPELAIERVGRRV
jgi:predicted ABC-type ATPase